MEHQTNRKQILIGAAIVLGVIVILAIVFGRRLITDAVAASETSYTYNIQGEIISIIGMVQPWKEPGEQFKYIVTVQIDTAETVKLSEASHVLPELGDGLHSVAIPDSDIAGYIDWESSRQRIQQPIDSAGVTIYTYELHEWVKEQKITLTCHEELGTAGQAELVCSEF